MLPIMKPIAEVMDKFHRTLTQNRTKFLTIELKFSYLICNACNLRNLLPWCNRVALVCQAIRDKKLFKNLDFRRLSFPQSKRLSQLFQNLCNTRSSNDWSECETSLPNFNYFNIHFINLLLCQEHWYLKSTKFWYFAMPKKLVKLFLEILNLTFWLCFSSHEKKYKNAKIQYIIIQKKCTLETTYLNCLYFFVLCEWQSEILLFILVN